MTDRPNQPMDIGAAVTEMQAGQRVARQGWNGANMWLAIQRPVEGGMDRPFVYIRPVDGQLTPWVASQLDLLATDWFVVQEVAA